MRPNVYGYRRLLLKTDFKDCTGGGIVMGRKDISAKAFMKEPEIFADFFNAAVFEGKQRVEADRLRELDTAQTAVLPVEAGKAVLKEKYRDILKNAIIRSDGRMVYMLLGIENQSDIHYAMPVRNLLYNALAYEGQVTETERESRDKGNLNRKEFMSGFPKDGKLTPVITVTLYWGDTHWDGPQTLKEMLKEYPDQLEDYIEDTNINLVEIIDSELYKACKSELRQVLQALSVRNDKEKLYETMAGPDYEDVSATAATVLSDYVNVKKPRKTRNGGYNMCKAIEELKKDWYAEGKEKGLESMVRILKGVSDNINDIFAMITKDANYRDVTMEMVKRYYQ